MNCLYLKIDVNRRKVVQHHQAMFPFDAWRKFSLNSLQETRKKRFRTRALTIYCFIIITLLICASLSRIIPEIGNDYLISVGFAIFSSSVSLYAVWTIYTKPNVMVLSPNKRYYLIGKSDSTDYYELIWTKNGKYIEIYYNSYMINFRPKYLRYYLNLTKIDSTFSSALLPFNSNGYVPLSSVPTKELQAYLGTTMIFANIFSDSSKNFQHSNEVHAMEKGSKISDSHILTFLVDIIEGTSRETLMSHINAMNRKDVLYMITQDERYKEAEPEVLTT